MRVYAEIFDTTELESKSLSWLFLMRDDLVDLKDYHESEKENFIKNRDTESLKVNESNLFYINRNIDLIEVVMIEKESDIFQFLICEDMCLN